MHIRSSTNLPPTSSVTHKSATHSSFAGAKTSASSSSRKNFDRHNFDRIISNLPLTVTSLSLALASLGSTLHNLTLTLFPPSSSLPPSFSSISPYTLHLLASTTAILSTICVSLSTFLLLLFVSKLLLSPLLILDELTRSVSSASPAGCLLMTLSLLSFNAHLDLLLLACGSLHLLLVIWFLTAAFLSRSLPDPSWWPNTIGIGLAAGRLADLSPPLALSLLLTSSLLFLFLFPVSLLRVY
ncbi:hypothetical protein TrRE_jg2933, partial [Triparma retinervis]